MTYALGLQPSQAVKAMFGLINKRDVISALRMAREDMYQSNVESHPALQAEIVEATKRAEAASRPDGKKTPLPAGHLGNGS